MGKVFDTKLVDGVYVPVEETVANAPGDGCGAQEKVPGFPLRMKGRAQGQYRRIPRQPQQKGKRRKEPTVREELYEKGEAFMNMLEEARDFLVDMTRRMNGK